MRPGLSWLARATLTVLALLLGGCVWLYGVPPSGQAHDAGPVVVLGGGTGDRFDLGRELVASSQQPRELVLSAGAADEYEAAGGDCDDDGVICVEPDPMNTYGEALTVSALARERGWEEVTVVTSEFHVTRTRLLFAYCMHTPTRVVASDSGLPVGARVERMPREAFSTLASLPAFRHCP